MTPKNCQSFWVLAAVKMKVQNYLPIAIFIILLITIAKIQRSWSIPIAPPEQDELLENMVFVKMGLIHLETSYGHLRVDLKLDEVVNGYRDLWAMMVLIYKQQQRMSYQPNAYRVTAAHHKMQHAMSRLFGMVSLITSEHDEEAIALAAWADKVNQLDTHFYEVINQLKALGKGKPKGLLPPPTGKLQVQVSKSQRPKQAKGERGERSPSKPQREKRQFFIAALAVGTLVSFGLSIYNTYELSNINTAIDAVHNEVNILAKEVDRSALKINEIIDWCDKAQRINKIITTELKELTDREVYDSTVNDLETMLDTFLHEIDDYIDGVTALQHQRFSPLLVKPHVLAEAYDELLIDGTEHQLHPVSENANIIFQCKVSVVAKMLPPPALPKLYAIIHVPFYTNIPLTLYRYHSVPILVGRVLLQFKGADYLATSPDGDYAKEMTAAELQDCTKFGTDFHCSEQNTINRNTKELCLYSLFFNAKPQQKCDVFVTKATAYTHQIGSGRFAYTSLHPFTIHMYCDKNMITPKFDERAAGTHIIVMKPNCRMYTTKEFVMMHNPEFDLTKDLITKPVRFNKSMLEEGVPPGWNAEQRILEHFANGSKLLPLNLQDLKAQFMAEEARYKSIILGGGTAVLAVVLAFISILIIAYLCYKCYRNRQQRRITKNEWDDMQERQRLLDEKNYTWRKYRVPMTNIGEVDGDPTTSTPGRIATGRQELLPIHSPIAKPAEDFEAARTSLHRQAAEVIFAANARNKGSSHEESYITSAPMRDSSGNLVTVTYAARYEDTGLRRRSMEQIDLTSRADIQVDPASALTMARRNMQKFQD